MTAQPLDIQGKLWPLLDRLITSGPGDDTVHIGSSDVFTALQRRMNQVTCLMQRGYGGLAQERLWQRAYGFYRTPDPLLNVRSTVMYLKQLVDGRIASGLGDGTVRIWSLNGLASIVLQGHTNQVTCLVQLVGDGSLASGSTDDTVCIWSPDGSTSTVLQGNKCAITRLLQLADGHLASGAQDGTVRIWSLDSLAPTVFQPNPFSVSPYDRPEVRIWAKRTTAMWMESISYRASRDWR